MRNYERIGVIYLLRKRLTCMRELKEMLERKYNEKISEEIQRQLDDCRKAIQDIETNLTLL